MKPNELPKDKVVSIINKIYTLGVLELASYERTVFASDIDTKSSNFILEAIRDRKLQLES